MPLRVVLADDHPIVREGLRVLLERGGIDVVGEAGDGREAVRLSGTLQPDVTLLDLFMPHLNGLDAAGEILRVRPDAAIVLMTMSREPHHVIAARRAGIGGYVVKTDGADELIAAIHRVASGELYVSDTVSQIALGAQLSAGDVVADPLTRGERQVLQLVVEGKKTKDIAAMLGMSVKTAESYRADVMAKLNTHDTAGLVRYAVRRGLIQALVACGASPRWITADPKSAMVTPPEGSQVTITVQRPGETSVRVTSNGVARELGIRAEEKGAALQVKISPKPKA
jgi:DNA-binding NarL/FixJ family response regulator